MFYQYYPYENEWGPMHWGHSVSKDLITWEYRPAIMAPDQPYDNFGCFSGSALELDDGPPSDHVYGRGKSTLRGRQHKTVPGLSAWPWETDGIM